mmetsp:Transcript_55464/g.76863  ORF Transcript_55464/g.76863 Transcript_55464/m.76863 type:complete len:205 (-) Transcript_55464:52-666(-)
MPTEDSSRAKPRIFLSHSWRLAGLCTTFMIRIWRTEQGARSRSRQIACTLALPRFCTKSGVRRMIFWSASSPVSALSARRTKGVMPSSLIAASICAKADGHWQTSTHCAVPFPSRRLTIRFSSEAIAAIFELNLQLLFPVIDGRASSNTASSSSRSIWQSGQRPLIRPKQAAWAVWPHGKSSSLPPSSLQQRQTFSDRSSSGTA